MQNVPTSVIEVTGQKGLVGQEQRQLKAGCKANKQLAVELSGVVFCGG